MTIRPAGTTPAPVPPATAVAERRLYRGPDSVSRGRIVCRGAGFDAARAARHAAPMTAEARMEETEHGRRPAGPGWFVVNLDEAVWKRCEGSGRWCAFEGATAESRFAELGVNVHVLSAGERACMYHGEDAQEAFLVLRGTCTLIVEGEERTLRAGDFVHCPAWTKHVFVGSGSEPCALVMMGARRPDGAIEYPVERAALRHGAGVTEATNDPKVAYADFPPVEPMRSPWPLGE